MIWRNNNNLNIVCGALALYNSTCKLTNSALVDNRALIGGDVFMDLSSSFSIDNNTKINNTAIKYGNNIATIPSYIEIKAIKTRNYNQTFDQYYNFSITIEKRDQNYSHYMFTNIAEYELEATEFYIQLYDKFNQTIFFRDSVSVFLNSTLDITSSFNIYEDRILMPNSLITLYQAGVQSDLLFSINYKDSWLNITLSFIPRACLPGEFEDAKHNHRCKLCSYGFYSFKPD